MGQRRTLISIPADFAPSSLPSISSLLRLTSSSLPTTTMRRERTPLVRRSCSDSSPTSAGRSHPCEMDAADSRMSSDAMTVPVVLLRSSAVNRDGDNAPMEQREERRVGALPTQRAAEGQLHERADERDEQLR